MPENDDPHPVSPHRTLVITTVAAGFVGLGLAVAVGASQRSSGTGALIFLPFAVLLAVTTSIAGAADAAPPAGTAITTPRFGRPDVSRRFSIQVPDLARLLSGTTLVAAVVALIAAVSAISGDGPRALFFTDVAILIAGIAGAQARSQQRPDPPTDAGTGAAAEPGTANEPETDPTTTET